MRLSRRLLIAAWSLGTILAHRPCLADAVARDPIAAEALFEAGKRLIKANDWEGACEKFRKSLELDPAVGTLIKIAKCHEHYGKLATAWYDFQRAESLNREKVEQSPARRRELDDFIRIEIKRLEARLPRLTISAREPPSDLELYRDGQPLSLAVLGEALPVDPGSHEVRAEAPGYVSERHSVDLLEGQTRVVTLSLVRTAAPVVTREGPKAAAPVVLARTEPPVVVPLAPSAPNERAEPSNGSGQRVVGYVLGGAGVIGLGVGGYFGVRTRSLVEESNPYCLHPRGACEDEGLRLRERAREAQTMGIVAASVGGAMLAAGAILVLTADGERRSVALSVTPTGVSGTLPW
jgi:hypothetical protein